MGGPTGNHGSEIVSRILEAQEALEVWEAPRKTYIPGALVAQGVLGGKCRWEGVSPGGSAAMKVQE